MGFKDKLSKLRKNLDLTQEELANRLGFSRTAISAWEIGRNEPPSEDLIKIADFFGVSLNFLLDADGQSAKASIPILGVVKAGYDYLANENIIGYLDPTPEIKDPENYFGLVVKGDSMAPLFLEGDYLLVHKQDGEYNSHDTCIVLINGNEATVKNIVKTDDGIELHAFNPCYPAKKYTFEEIKDLPIVILGKVVKLIRNLK